VPSGAVRGRPVSSATAASSTRRRCSPRSTTCANAGSTPTCGSPAGRTSSSRITACSTASKEVKADDDAGDEVGTTGRGIGPTYEDKAGRRGIRVADLLDPDVLRDKLEYAVPQKRALVVDVYGLKA